MEHGRLIDNAEGHFADAVWVLLLDLFHGTFNRSTRSTAHREYSHSHPGKRGGEGLPDSSVDNSTTVARLQEICCVVICLILSSCSRTIWLVSGQDTRPYNRRGE